MLFLSRGQVRDGRKFESYFHDSVQGLDVGAPVKFRGVSLGQVTQIGLVSVLYPDAVPAQPVSDARQKDLQMVVVRYTIDPKKAGKVPDPSRSSQLGLRARIAAVGITGISYVELDFVNPAQFPAGSVPWTPKDALLPSMPSTITQVQDAGQALLAKLQTLDLKQLTDDLDRLTVTAQLVFDDLDGAITQSDLPGLSAELKAMSASVRGVVQGKPTQEMLTATHDAALRLPKLIDQLQQTSTRTDDGLADLQQRLAPLLRDVAVITANLRQTSETLRTDPASVLLGAPPPRDKQR
jgi:ABC-type transporter Mla subunit MlaD